MEVRELFLLCLFQLSFNDLLASPIGQNDPHLFPALSLALSPPTAGTPQAHTLL